MKEDKSPLMKIVFIVMTAGIILAAGVWVGAVIAGMIQFFPWGLVGFVPLAVGFILVFSVIRDRLNSREDDYYSDNIDQ